MVSEDELFELADPKLRLHIATKFKHYRHNERNACLGELLKYLYLSSKYAVLSRTFIPVTQEVDNFWHELILQTRLYQQLCSRLPSQRMIHHESLEFDQYQSNVEKNKLVDEVLRWMVLYVRNFGGMKEERAKYWFFISKVIKTLDITLAKLNSLAEHDTYFAIEEPMMLATQFRGSLSHFATS